MKKAIITGAGGFIGFHLANYLKKKGYTVVGIDVKKPEFAQSQADTFILADLTQPDEVHRAFGPADELYMLAADMGGIGYIDSVHAKIMHDNVLINTLCLEEAVRQQIPKVFFSSSACVYPLGKQTESGNDGLREEDAVPADPDSMYGWEKLFSEKLCTAYAMDHGIEVRIARFHNIYGPYGTYDGGREKSPAAICRKLAVAKEGGTIEVWGDGEQTRSYCYIDDCCEGVYRLMQSKIRRPINIGSDRSITINELIDIVAKIAGKKIKKTYLLKHPQGVRGRNSDNTLIRKLLKWEPTTPLEEGMRQTYEWIDKSIRAHLKK
jgi:nucleoside-diphosphate-sugar epimerase